MVLYSESTREIHLASLICLLRVIDLEALGSLLEIIACAYYIE